MTSQDKNLGSGCVAVIAWGLIAAGVDVGWKLFNQPPKQQELAGQLIGMAFCFAFGGPILIYGGRVRRKAKRLARGKVDEPDRPWLWRDDWAVGRIEASFLDQYQTQLFVGGGGLVFAVGGAYALLVQRRELTPENFAVALLGLVLGLLGAGWSAYCLFSWFWHGSATFEMARTPGAPGGRLEGVVLASQTLRSAPNVTVTLRRLHTVEVKDFANSSEKRTETRVLWEDERVIDRLLDAGQPGRVGVPVRFSIPSDQTDTNEWRQIAWRLEVAAATPVVGYRTSFEVPIFATRGEARDAGAPDDLMDAYEVDRTLAEVLAIEGLRCEETAEELKIVSPPGRPLSMVIASGLCSALCCFPLFFIANEWVWIIAVPSLLCALLLAHTALEQTLGTTELSVRGENWRVRNGWIGFRRVNQEFVAADIKGFRTNTKGDVNTGTHMRAIRDVYAARHRGGRVLLVRSISNRATERRLIAELRRRAGLE